MSEKRIAKYGTVSNQCDGVIEHKTMYGYTCVHDNLELHVGEYYHDKRGGTRSAYVFDTDDYRYRCLRRSLGISNIPLIQGCLLGCYYGKDDNTIRFRIKEDTPTHLLICCMGSRSSAVAIERERPEAFTTGSESGYFYAVYPLGRANTKEYGNEEDYDGFYDEDPDSQDLSAAHYTDEKSESEMISYRLYISGF